MTTKIKEVVVPVELMKSRGERVVTLPEYARRGDAGMDVYASETIIVKPGETRIIPTGIKVAIPEGYEIQVRDKSGIASSTRLRVANAPGTIDSGYRDEIGVIIDNISIDYRRLAKELFSTNIVDIVDAVSSSSDKLYSIDKKDPDFKKNAEGTYVIRKGQKIAQLVLNKVEHMKLLPVDSIDTHGIESRGGGFGSTGITYHK